MGGCLPKRTHGFLPAGSLLCGQLQHCGALMATATADGG